MKYLSVIFFVGLLLCQPIITIAQNEAAPADTIKVVKQPRPLRIYNSARTYILPSAMILYGALSLKNEPFKKWNESIRNTVGASDGRQHTNIDDYLEFTNAVASHVISIAGVKPRHKLFDRLMIDGMTAALSTSVVMIIKNNSHEIRPDGSDDYSFPSNHVATAFASAELLRQEYGDISPWYGIAGYAVAAATGYLRMYNNKHWLGDVMAGAGIGIVSAKIATQLFPIAKKILFNNKTPFAAVFPTYQNGSIGVHIFKTLP